MAKDPGDYETGYGKPPRHSRWQKGQSGNPKGRAKGKRGLKTDLAQAIDGQQTISIGGKKITGTRQSLTLLTLASRAAAGDIKAASHLLPLIVQTFGIEDRGGGKSALSASDQALLDKLLGRIAQADGDSDDP